MVRRIRSLEGKSHWSGTTFMGLLGGGRDQAEPNLFSSCRLWMLWSKKTAICFKIDFLFQGTCLSSPKGVCSNFRPFCGMLFVKKCCSAHHGQAGWAGFERSSDAMWSTHCYVDVPAKCELPHTGTQTETFDVFILTCEPRILHNPYS